MKYSDECFFPDDRFYDVDRDLWFKHLSNNIFRVGVTQPFLFFSGRPQNIKIRVKGTYVRKNTPIALIVSNRMEGALLSPVDCQILKVNEEVMNNPDTLANDPYGLGWVAEIISNSEPAGLSDAQTASKLYEKINVERGVACFKIVPHYRVTIFGETCESILTQIGDFMTKHLKPSEALYVITGDPATEVDMIGWAEKAGQELVGLKRIGTVLHVVYRKRG